MNTMKNLLMMAMMILATASMAVSEITPPTTKDLLSALGSNEETDHSHLAQGSATPKQYIKLIKDWESGQIGISDIFKRAIKNPNGWIMQGWLKTHSPASELRNVYILVELDRLEKSFKTGNLNSILVIENISKGSKYADMQLKRIKKEMPKEYALAMRIKEDYRSAKFNIERYSRSEIEFGELMILSQKNDFIRKALKGTIPKYKKNQYKNPKDKRRRIVFID